MYKIKIFPFSITEGEVEDFLKEINNFLADVQKDNPQVPEMVSVGDCLVIRYFEKSEQKLRDNVRRITRKPI